MTKDALKNRIMAEFKPEEFALINTNIYSHEDHVDYYIDFKAGRYDKCYKYLLENRNLLTIEHTPEKFIDQAKLNIKNANQLFN